LLRSSFQEKGLRHIFTRKKPDTNEENPKEKKNGAYVSIYGSEKKKRPLLADHELQEETDPFAHRKKAEVEHVLETLAVLSAKRGDLLRAFWRRGKTGGTTPPLSTLERRLTT